jgi:hypothetical protein
VRFVREPFRPSAWFDFEAMERTAEVAVRFLDDVLDVTFFPLEREAEVARATRRIGLGVTGLADALILLGRQYDLADGRETAGAIVRRIRDAAYRTPLPWPERAARSRRTIESDTWKANTFERCRRASGRRSPRTGSATRNSWRLHRPRPSACWPAMSAAAWSLSSP